MYSNLCLIISAVYSWWGVVMATICWKLCNEIEEPENISQDYNFTYKILAKNTCFSIEDDCISEEYIEDIRKRPVVETMERSCRSTSIDFIEDLQAIDFPYVDSSDALYEMV